MTRRTNGKGTTRTLSHVDARGQARMVDVSAKTVTTRVATARGAVRMRPATLKLITSGRIAKGEVLAVARLAGIMAAKRTGEWIPLCHPLPLEAVNLDFAVRGRNRIDIEARATITAKTGVEMEALVAVSAAALTIYDMCKAVDRDMTIGDIQLVEKSGGRSGTYRRKT